MENVHLDFDNPFHLPLFLGNEDEDINDFIRHFTYLADFHKWTLETKESFALQICLKGEALSWFNSLPEHISRNFQHTFDALRCKYYSATYVWIQRLKLSERRQEIT